MPIDEPFMPFVVRFFCLSLCILFSCSMLRWYNSVEQSIFVHTSNQHWPDLWTQQTGGNKIHSAKTKTKTKIANKEPSSSHILYTSWHLHVKLLLKHHTECETEWYFQYSTHELFEIILFWLAFGSKNSSSVMYSDRFIYVVCSAFI